MDAEPRPEVLARLAAAEREDTSDADRLALLHSLHGELEGELERDGDAPEGSA